MPAATLNAEDRFRRLVEDLRLIVWEFDPASKRFVYVSPQAQAILGHPLEQWQRPQFWYDHVHPDDRAEALRFSHEHVERGLDHAFEYRMLRADGASVWFRDITSLIKDHGRVVALHGVLIDITQRKTAEEALLQSEHRFRSMAENSVVGIWQITPEGHTLYINPSMCRMLGVASAADMPGRTYHEFFTPESLRVIAVELAKRREGIASSYEVDMRSKQGRQARVIIAGSPVFGPDGRVESIIGTFTDITERKQAETALRHSEARLRAIIENTPDVAIQGYDRDGRVQFWNRATHSLFGWPETEAVGRTLDELILDQAGAAEFVASLRAIERTGKPSGPGEWAFTRRDGRRGWCYSTVFAIADALSDAGRDPVFICMDVDITEHKRVQQELERGNHVHRLLLSELDHRVRNNLASLLALIDISARDSRSVPEFAASMRDRVQAMSTVHALLSREHWRSVGLRELLLTLAPPGRPDAVRANGPAVAVLSRQATALGMVLQELFANSLKHGALGSPTGSVEVKWSLDGHDATVDEPDADSQATRLLRLTWRERGGRAITQPIIPSVGTRLIDGLVRAELAGEATLTYPSNGAEHAFALRLDAFEHAQQ